MKCNPEAMMDLMSFLDHHEADIAYDINDFGDLKGVFQDVFGREPRENPTPPDEAKP